MFFHELLEDIYNNYRPKDMSQIHPKDQRLLASQWMKENPYECGEPWARKPLNTSYPDAQ